MARKTSRMSDEPEFTKQPVPTGAELILAVSAIPLTGHVFVSLSPWLQSFLDAERAKAIKESVSDALDRAVRFRQQGISHD